jgi:hypothetical protein
VRSHCWNMRRSWRLPYPWRTGEVTLLVHQTLVEGPLEELFVGLAGKYSVVEASVRPAFRITLMIRL